MRADRLISLLMLLQARGRVTAAQLAEELEVSERTIYRDVDALSTAGVPIYAERGPDGGFALLNEYRSTLTGLTESEQRAVLLLSVPSAVADLGLDRALASALRKFAAAVTASNRDEEARVRQRFYVDTMPWSRREPVSPQLSRLQMAVWNDRRVWVTYRLPSGPTIEQYIEVYGLVARDGDWYAIYLAPTLEAAPRDGAWEDRVLALALGDLVAVRLTEEQFHRRFDFDLVRAWKAWCRGRDRPSFEMTLRVAPALASRLSGYGIRTRPSALYQDAEGRVAVTGVCESFDAARASVLALGGAVEVMAPEPLRRSVLDYAEQVVQRYAVEVPVVVPVEKRRDSSPAHPRGRRDVRSGAAESDAGERVGEDPLLPLPKPPEDAGGLMLLESRPRRPNPRRE